MFPDTWIVLLSNWTLDDVVLPKKIVNENFDGSASKSFL